MDNITKAKAQLVVEQPFFASLLLGMDMTEDSRVPTIGTDGENIFYNSKFMNTLTLPETVFILAHEVMHCVFLHMHRRGERNFNRWNIAGDYIINDCLVKEKVGIMPKVGLYDPNLVIQAKETTEGVYNLLPEETEDKEAGDGKNGGSMDSCMDSGKDAADRSQKETEMRMKVIQAQNAAKMHGKLSANIQRLVGEFTQPRVDWRAVLRRFITEKAKVELSYSKPKRRWLAEDLYLPSMSGEKMGNVVIAVDCSGSIDDIMLKKFAAEVKGIIEDTMPAMTHVIYFDSEVLRTDSFSPDDEFQIKAVGGGGTAFSPIFRTIEEKQLEPVCCVVLTDLQCSDFGECPSYPVLWTTTDLETAPFGEIVKLKE